jgi:hypothetical protein
MYEKMPFELMNAGATFQRAMDITFMGERDKFMVIYLDDITIFSKSDDEYLQQIIRPITNMLMIQVDIGGHPPFPTGSKQFSGNFGNLLFLAGFNFWGHFEGLNEGFF